jgi:hypothetical protein
LRLLADENIPYLSVEVLRTVGHDVMAVLEQAPGLPIPASCDLPRQKHD